MKYEIISISESYARYRDSVKDVRWIGEINGLVNGWQFEYIKDGKYEYGDVFYCAGSAEEYANRWHNDDGSEWVHDTARYAGYEPTGRVVFRGYATEYYDYDEREWFVEDYDISKELSYMAD